MINNSNVASCTLFLIAEGGCGKFLYIFPSVSLMDVSAVRDEVLSISHVSLAEALLQLQAEPSAESH